VNRPDILAAGAVVLRHSPDPQVLVVHRARYDDWSLPKGKLKRGEQLAACAVREVAEETGVRIRLTGSLGAHAYPVDGLTKQVHWWIGEVLEESAHTPDHEVDEVRWLPVEEAAERLSYTDESERLLKAVAQPPTTPLVLLRHAKALHRKDWTGIDDERPLSQWGMRQSRALVPLLAAFGVRRVISSAAVRCVDTVRPFACSAGLELDCRQELMEEQGQAEPAGVLATMVGLRDETVRTGEPTVVCGHRPVLPTMLTALDLGNGKFATAELLVAQLARDERVHSVMRITLRIR
jgi:8-oxo-dGTP pyrophosphatase MutT (NUDIX family)/phosphohistidine phosphatase SixA